MQIKADMIFTFCKFKYLYFKILLELSLACFAYALYLLAGFVTICTKTFNLKCIQPVSQSRIYHIP